MTACGPLCAPIAGGAEPRTSPQVQAGVGRLREALRHKASGKPRDERKSRIKAGHGKHPRPGHTAPQRGAGQGIAGFGAGMNEWLCGKDWTLPEMSDGQKMPVLQGFPSRPLWIGRRYHK